MAEMLECCSLRECTFGPQVGNMLLRTELSRDKVPELPLGICVADTEGAIGYMIQQAMVNSLQKEQINKCVVTVLTQVIVDKNDTAFIINSYLIINPESQQSSFLPP